RVTTSAGGGQSTTVPFGTTTRPLSVTVNPRARSSSWSTPIRARSLTTTFLSTIARCTCAYRCTCTSSMSTELDTFDHECRCTPGESTDPAACAPEMSTPGDTIDSTACPMRPGPTCTNLAGGSPVYPVNSGHSLLYRLNTGCTEMRSMLAS